MARAFRKPSAPACGNQYSIAVPEMINPHGRIDEHCTHLVASGTPRGISGIPGAAPPTAASRCAARTRTKVLMASRNRSALSIAGSATSSALLYSSSSMVTVVLMTVFCKSEVMSSCISRSIMTRKYPGVAVRCLVMAELNQSRLNGTTPERLLPKLEFLPYSFALGVTMCEPFWQAK